MTENSRRIINSSSIVLIFVGVCFLSFTLFSKKIDDSQILLIPELEESAVLVPIEEVPQVLEPIQESEGSFHISTPPVVRGLYVSGWTAGTQVGMNRIMNIIDTTNLNTIVIDIKDATGRLSYQPLDPELRVIGSGTNRIRNLSSLVEKLHEKDIYIIGRVSVFQDPYYAVKYPSEAFKDTRTGDIWMDYKRLEWLRPDSIRVWDYTVAIAQDAYNQGFDEIQLDYVRFPSDGNLSALDRSGFAKGRAETIEDFFIYMNQEIRYESGIPLSADLFGLVVNATDDIGIGQELNRIAPYVDFVSPMIYPSHFASGSYGYSEPVKNPYQIIYKSLTDGKEKIAEIGLPPHTLRPWLQDFSLGTIYTSDMVRAQIQASEDAGIDSWLMWDPKNIYTRSAFESVLQ